MSKNFKKPGIPSRPSQSQMQQFRDQTQSEKDLRTGPRQFQVPVTPIFHEEYQAQYNGHYGASNISPSNGIPSSHIAEQNFPDTQSQENGNFSQQAPYAGYGPQNYQAPATPSLGISQVPMTPFANFAPQQYQVPATPFFGMSGVPATPSLDAPVRPFPDLPTTPPSGVVTIPSSPIPSLQPDIIDPHRRDRVAKYAQWLQINNNIPVSPQKTQAYQEASLEVKKIGKREVRTFAPFQERTSALQVITSSQLATLGALGACWLIGLVLLHLVIFTITLSIVTLLYICGFITSGVLATRSFNGPSGEKIDEDDIIALDRLGVEWPTYTVLCPLYKETAIVPQFVQAMKSLNYPVEKLQVLFLTEENDSETRAALYSMRLTAGFTVLTVPKGSPQTKPRACNFGLLQAKGQFVVIFDAEDKPEPYQLKKAVLAFAKLGPEVACVQAKLNYYNTRQNLLTRWFTAEYSTWFDIMLPGLQQSSFSLPLGGTSNHFRSEVLRALGGWDAFNVTEDCDLGLRISQYGLKTAVLDSTTYEEATSRVKIWLFQRSRWIKGYLQTYLVHMRHPLQTLQQKHLRKFFSLQIIVGAWTVVLLINPFMWTLTLIYILLRPIHLYSILFPGPILYMGAFCLVFGNFFYVYVHVIGCLRRKEYTLIKWVLLIPIYWVMMSASAYLAFYQLIVKPHYWEKTQHGSHLAPSTRSQVHALTPNLEPEGRAVVVSMPTTQLFAITVGRVFKRASPSPQLGTTTQRVTAIRSTLSTQLGHRKARWHFRLPRFRDRWLALAIGMAIISSIITTIYFFENHLTLVDSDANSHMEIARRIFDNATPGLAQLGGVWLPLPHILIALFAWNDYLWATGLAGSIVGMGCYLGTVVFTFFSARRLTNNSCVSFIGTLVFILNPNVLYLQATPMTESVSWLTMTASCYYLLAWAQDDSKKYLVLTAASCFLATLVRYDGWFIFVVLLAAIPLIGLLKQHSLREVEGNLAVFMILGGLGIVLWFAWGQVIFGDPFYFKNGPYSAQQQAIDMASTNSSLLHNNLPLDIRLYTIDTIETLGTGLFILALFAILFFLLRRWKLSEKIAALTFLAPFVFYVIAIYGNQVPIGNFATFHPLGIIPSIERNSLYNARFGAEMVAPLAIFIATFVPTRSKLASVRQRLGGLLGRTVLIMLIVLQSGWVAYGGVIAILGSTNPSFCIEGYSINVYLAQHYDGGYILQSDYPFHISEAQAGIHFSNVIYGGSGPLWTQALQHPETSVDWIIFQPGDIVAKAMDRTGGAFLQNFTLVATGPYGLQLFHRKGLPPLPTRTVTSYLLSEQQFCSLSTYQQKRGT